MLNRLLFFIVCVVCGCQKKTTTFVEPSLPSKSYYHLEAVWTKNMPTSTSISYIGLYKNVVLYGIDDANFNETIVAYDKLTGDSLWSHNCPGFLASGYRIYKNSMVYFVNGNSHMEAFDLENGNNLWSFVPENNGRYAGHDLFNGKVYYAVTMGYPINDSTLVYEIDPNNGNYKVVFRLYSKDRNGNEIWLRFAEPWINPKGETIIPLLIRGYNNKESSSLSALNLTTKSFYFDYQDTIKGDPMLNWPVRIGDKVYYKGWDYHCRIDLNTKAIDYVKPIDDSLKANNRIQGLNNQIIFISANNYHTSCYDLEGNLLWKVKDGGAGEYPMISYKNKYYYTAGGNINCLNASGKMEWYSPPMPKSYRYFNGKMVLDESSGCLYTWSIDQINCLKIKYP